MFSVTSIPAAWAVVLASGLLEIVFSVALKLSDGFSRPLAGAVAVLAGGLSVWLMSLSLKLLPVGTAYAVWAGIGALGTAVIGMVWFAEAASLARLASIAAIVGGIVALQLQSA